MKKIEPKVLIPIINKPSLKGLNLTSNSQKNSLSAFKCSKISQERILKINNPIKIESNDNKENLDSQNSVIVFELSNNRKKEHIKNVPKSQNGKSFKDPYEIIQNLGLGLKRRKKGRKKNSNEEKKFRSKSCNEFNKIDKLIRENLLKHKSSNEFIITFKIFFLLSEKEEKIKKRNEKVSRLKGQRLLVINQINEEIRTFNKENKNTFIFGKKKNEIEPLKESPKKSMHYIFHL